MESSKKAAQAIAIGAAIFSLSVCLYNLNEWVLFPPLAAFNVALIAWMLSARNNY